VRYLERQVEEERHARRRADTLVDQLMMRSPSSKPPRRPHQSRQDRRRWPCKGRRGGPTQARPSPQRAV
jgi:hypothetical protein